MVWADYKPVIVTVKSLLGKQSILKYKDTVNYITLQKGKSRTVEY